MKLVDRKVVIAVAGSKGGTGKTTISNLIAHGFASYGVAAAALVTDPDREWEARKDEKTRYMIVDARTSEQFVDFFDQFESYEDPEDPGFVVVIDGAGNRKNTYELMAGADLVLIPFGPSASAIDSAANDIEDFKKLGVQNLRLVHSGWMPEHRFPAKLAKVANTLPTANFLNTKIPFSAAFDKFTFDEVAFSKMDAANGEVLVAGYVTGVAKNLALEISDILMGVK